MRIIVALIALIAAAAVGFWGYTQFVKGDDRKAASAFADQADQIAALKALGETTPTSPVADEATYQAFAQAVSKFATVAYGGFEQDDAGLFAKDVTVTLLTDDEIGARIGKLQIWGADEAAFAAIKAGDFDSGVRVADRIEMNDISYFGIREATDRITKSYLGAIEDIASDAVGEGADAAIADAFEYDIEEYEMSIKRTFVDGLTLHPLPIILTLEEGDQEKSVMAYVQEWAHLARAVSFDATASYGMSAKAQYEMQGQKTSIVFGAPFSATKGVRRGDIDFTVTSDLILDMNIEVPASELVTEDGIAVADPEGAPFETAFVGGVETYSLEDIRLSKVLEYLANGEMPPTTDTDLLSLGVWRVLGEYYGFGDEPFYRVEESIIDFSNFHWLAPTNIRAKSNGITYDIEGVLKWAESLAAITPEADAVEAQQTMQDAANLLNEQGFSRLRFDSDFSGVWDPETGDTALDYYLDFKDFSRMSVKAAGALGDFQAFASLIPEGEAPFDEAAALEIFEQSKFSGFDFVITDDGGIDRSFALAVAFADLAPEGDPSMQLLKGANVGDLKVSSAAMIRISSGQAAQAFPPAGPYLQSLADFIQKGGAFRVSANPATPVSLADIEAATAEDPTKIVDLLGLKIEQTSSKEIERAN